ncbi:dTDP-4-amino-4,6-dideoxygalactose transaminase [Pseudobutyrivibrio ruminis]|uniref:dTDP-4-amino-4,6-dideoxygalactose transaminase n=1 Tax=Pseudobutyrivibrio ruminis TaxID=46206 RepID=A0A1H7HBH1_9FIRM|nr:DegT/DnrJ/EryC1/StrS family aminotransferase [Pseudobutyrivibrio ruminis]SEK46370.1 dTDP-4-amino-4,6-dideoxygalactose transaminase [Pseudobutyrivibrio ruminis]
MSENEILLRNIPFSPPDITEAEVEEVAKALKSGWITTGPRTKLLERRLAAYIDTGKNDVDCESEAGVAKYSNRVVCLNSATAAEELNLRIWGVGPGDEVIVPAYTYTASASAVCHCGATPVFVDIQPNGNSTSHMPEYDYEALEAAITEKTKAIVVVDLGGLVGDYERVFEIAERQKSKFVPKNTADDSLDELSSKIQQGLGRVAIVADCAHSLGASATFKGQKTYAGNLADFSSFSFHAVKNFTTAEGGASSWKLPKSVYDTGVTDAEIYHMYQLLSLHGQSKDALAKTQIGAWEYDIVGPWYKCNMTDIMAAIGLRQLDRYLGLLDRRLEIIRKYDNACDELGLLHLNHHMDGMDSSNHLYLMRVPNATEQQRNELIIKLAERGVATNVHYKPLPMMTAYKKMGYDIKDFPNAYDYYRNEITLPLHTNLSDEDVDYIIASLKAVFAK